jgi:hypothetical protein
VPSLFSFPDLLSLLAVCRRLVFSRLLYAVRKHVLLCQTHDGLTGQIEDEEEADEEEPRRATLTRYLF